jgi:hypothetical protein
VPHRQQAVGKTDEWYTPPYVFQAKGCEYDDDVASPGQHITPWIPAKRFITRDSLDAPWNGFVWMNPPFGGRANKALWLEKFFAHGNGVALVPDRTSAPWWQQYAPRADLVLFVAPKIKFLGPMSGGSPAQGTTLLAAGARGAEALRRAASMGLGKLMVPA